MEAGSCLPGQRPDRQCCRSVLKHHLRRSAKVKRLKAEALKHHLLRGSAAGLKIQGRLCQQERPLPGFYSKDLQNRGEAAHRLRRTVWSNGGEGGQQTEQPVEEWRRGAERI